MALIVFYHPTFLLHLTGSSHPERPERLIVIRNYLEKEAILSQVKELEPRPATVQELERVHTKEHIVRVRELAKGDGGFLDSDTVVSYFSYDAALLAAGAAICAIEEVLKGNDAFCLVRPPGHHATSDNAMGFCLFNNLAVAAAYALEEKKLSKILIVDWDAHHGNGLQEIFYSDPRVLYTSLHQSPLYPGTGAISELGSGKGAGFNINIPFPPLTGETAYLQAFEEIILPAARSYAPELIMIASGYDAHFSDPLASLLLQAKTYSRLVAILKEEFKLPFVVSLEGGYDLHALAFSAAATIAELASLPIHFEEEPGPQEETMLARKVVEAVKEVHLAYWPL